MNRILVVAALCGVFSAPAFAQNQPVKPAAVPDSEKLEKSAESLNRMKSALTMSNSITNPVPKSNWRGFFIRYFKARIAKAVSRNIRF